MCRLYLLYRRLWVVLATCCAVPSTHRAQVEVESLNCSHSFATIIELLIDATLLYLKATIWCSLPKYLPHRWIIPSQIDFQNWMLNYLPPAKNRFSLSSSVVVAGNMSVLPWGKFVKKFHSLSCGWYAQQSYLRIKPPISPTTFFCENQVRKFFTTPLFPAWVVSPTDNSQVSHGPSSCAEESMWQGGCHANPIGIHHFHWSILGLIAE